MHKFLCFFLASVLTISFGWGISQTFTKASKLFNQPHAQHPVVIAKN
jgi:hypothetical protein